LGRDFYLKDREKNNKNLGHYQALQTIALFLPAKFLNLALSHKSYAFF
jgi:hypothetical protein